MQEVTRRHTATFAPRHSPAMKTHSNPSDFNVYSRHTHIGGSNLQMFMQDFGHDDDDDV